MDTAIVKLLILCMLGHYLADFVLQGCLAQMKQRSWWEDTIKKHNETHERQLDMDFYRNDWKAALQAHSFYWSVITFLPIMFLTSASDIFFASIIVINAVFHTVVDNLKCNEYKLNLVQDQALHNIQIVATVIVTYIVYC